MSEHQPSREDNQRPKTSLYEAYGSLRPVQRSFSLLSDIETFGSDVKEWITSKTTERIVTFKGGSSIEDVHDYLLDSGVDLLPKRVFGKDVVLSVPEGARSMRNIAGYIERDPEHYSVVFQVLGRQLRNIHESNIGFPSGNWLDQFAYHPDSTEKYGAKVVLLPPYSVSSEEIDPMTTIGQQLAETTNLNETTVTQLMWEVHDGWNRDA